MANPNSADNVARKAKDKKMAAILADEAKAAKAPRKSAKVGTAADPVKPEASIDPATAQIGANHREELKAVLNSAIIAVTKSDEMTQAAWLSVGRTLIDLRGTFLKYENGAVVTTEAGEPALDKRAYGAWLEAEGYTKGILSNPNTRSAAIWMAENEAEWTKVPACVKHGHPVHIQTAFSQFKTWLKTMPDGDAADFVQVKAKGEGNGAAATSPATKLAFRREFTARLNKRMKLDDAPLDDGWRGSGKPWQLAVMVEVLFGTLNDALADVDVAKAEAKAANETLARLKAKIDTSGSVEDADFVVVAEPVAERPTQLALPAPTKAAKAKPAKAAKAKGNGAAKGKGKAKGEDAMDKLAAKGKARKAKAKTETVDAEYTEVPKDEAADADQI